MQYTTLPAASRLDVQCWEYVEWPDREYDVFEDLLTVRNVGDVAYMGSRPPAKRWKSSDAWTTNEVIAICISTKEIAARANRKDASN